MFLQNYLDGGYYKVTFKCSIFLIIKCSKIKMDFLKRNVRILIYWYRRLCFTYSEVNHVCFYFANNLNILDYWQHICLLVFGGGGRCWIDSSCNVWHVWYKTLYHLAAIVIKKFLATQFSMLKADLLDGAPVLLVVIGSPYSGFLLLLISSKSPFYS